MSETIKNSISYTFHLFNRPSVGEGYARLVDIYGELNSYDYSPDGETADIKALKNDWAALNMDMLKSYRNVLRKYEEKEKERAI